MKLSLKKQQEREIVYIIVHCLFNEKTYNPYYSFLMHKFCDYDRRFKVGKVNLFSKFFNLFDLSDDTTISHMG